MHALFRLNMRFDVWALTRPQVLFATGDTLAQHAVERVPRHDFGRTGRMALYGGGVFTI